MTTPNPPPPNLLLAVYDVIGTREQWAPMLAAIGTAVSALTAGDDPRLAGIAPGDLTITIGVGPRLVAAVAPSGPGATDLPFYARESMTDQERGGDLVLMVAASDPLVLPLALAAVANTPGVRERWRQRGARGPSVDVDDQVKAPRNVLGFVDGIVGPNSAAEQDSSVWLSGEPAVTGATIMVVRRMALDVTTFVSQPIAGQEAVIGRRRDTAAPLSGPSIATMPDLGAKQPDGTYVIPVDAHVRRANALSAGVDAPLRRSYSIDDPSAGVLFICFQRSLATFTKIMARMQAGDALLALTTTTATGTFLVLPGFTADRPLGSTLFR